ncbi:MAG TPA: hypothetical protein VGC27_12880 [Rhizomicrobium sp.]
MVAAALIGMALCGCAAIDKATGWSSPDTGQSPAPPQPVAAPPPAAPAAPKAKPVGRGTPEQRRPAKLAAINPNSLIGLNPPAVEKLLGPPATVSKDDPSLVWTYAAGDCSFRIFFYPDLKTSSFRALKYGGTDGKDSQIKTSDACIRNILTVKNNGAG